MVPVADQRAGSLPRRAWRRRAVPTGFITNRFGLTVGTLFQPLPAPSAPSATLIEKDEMLRTREAGPSGEQRRQTAAAVDSARRSRGAAFRLRPAYARGLDQRARKR